MVMFSQLLQTFGPHPNAGSPCLLMGSEAGAEAVLPQPRVLPVPETPQEGAARALMDCSEGTCW